MSKELSHKEITDYFRSNIYEAISSYNAWKMLSYSKSNKVVSDDMAKRYLEIQNYHPGFFATAERAFLVDFVIMSLHPFDHRDDSYSLYKINKEDTEDFINNNESVVAALRNLRNKLFAHRDADINNTKNLIIPSVVNQNKYFENLIDFYNKLTSVVDESSTNFVNAKEIKLDIENLFMNLYRGEAIRKKQIDIEWLWEKDNKKASDIL
ncbi:MAG: hypothetical protein WC705_01735 [Candidatus Paceibacterota bacterium]|jgi:hypothetical protein